MCFSTGSKGPHDWRQKFVHINQIQGSIFFSMKIKRTEYINGQFPLWGVPAWNHGSWIDRFWYIKIQPKTIDLSTRFWGISTDFVGFIPQTLVLRSFVLGWILIYRNWSILTPVFAYLSPISKSGRHYLSSLFSVVLLFLLPWIVINKNK